MLLDRFGAPLPPAPAPRPREEPNRIRHDQFVHDQPVPEAWAAELRAISPPDEHISWLELGWVAGTPEAAIQRWVLYEAIPRAHVAQSDYDTLEHMATMERAADHSAEERRIIRYWQQTGAVLKPFWIIQGERGGHRYRFTREEQRQLRLAELPDEPPLPGDLPYAPFDARVIRQIRQWDVLRHSHADIRTAQLEERKARAQEWRATWLDWLQRQITLENVYRDVDLDEHADHIPRTEREAMPAERLAEVEEHFIRTGRLLPARNRARA